MSLCECLAPCKAQSHPPAMVVELSNYHLLVLLGPLDVVVLQGHHLKSSTLMMTQLLRSSMFQMTSPNAPRIQMIGSHLQLCRCFHFCSQMALPSQLQLPIQLTLPSHLQLASQLPLPSHLPFPVHLQLPSHHHHQLPSKEGTQLQVVAQSLSFSFKPCRHSGTCSTAWTCWLWCSRNKGKL
ncbi:uncharacterized protein LOC135104943 [Scylla paramamosain]|uniref:uncharacterized protein LOC135104943 n=1 Tax=Scylla paramamosain TaxID=85552 RepID=UPI0030826FA1